MPKAVKPVTFPPQPRKKNGMIDPAAPKIIAILLVHRFDRNDALGNSRSEFRVWAKPRENSLVPRCAAEPRVRSTHQFDGIAALVLSNRNSAMFANAVVFGAGGAAGVGPHSGLAPVGAGAEPPITKRECPQRSCAARSAGSPEIGLYFWRTALGQVTGRLRRRLRVRLRPLRRAVRERGSRGRPPCRCRSSVHLPR